MMTLDPFGIETACENMLWLWIQYGNSYRDEKGLFHINHSCMSAGEDATDFLEHYGYGIDQGWSITLTRKGLATVMEEDCIGIDEIKDTI